MKRFRILSLMLVLVLSLGLFIGCQNDANTETTTDTTVEETTEDTNVDESEEQADQSQGQSYTVVDGLGRELEFNSVPERVIAISPSDAENLHAIGAIEYLVGRGTYVDYPEEALEATEVASGSDMNPEQILALEPDLIIMSDMGTNEEQVSVFENEGINVLITPAKTVEEVYESIGNIGKAMNKSEEAEKVIADMKSQLEELSQNSSDNEGKTIYFEISPLEYGLWTAGSNTFMDEIGAMLGLENIFKDVEGFAEISEEEVISRNPDYIVTISMGTTSGETPVEEILNRPGWDGVTAVSEENILNLVNDELSRPSVRLVEGAKALSEFVSN